jgi:hypothetical protein
VIRSATRNAAYMEARAARTNRIFSTRVSIASLRLGHNV